jgi:NAD(P)H-nitrite reductase large subunit
MTNAAAAKLPEEENDRIVCFCHCVKLSQIEKAIAQGSNSIEKIQSDTQASTGCGGCESEIREILESAQKKP